MTIQTDSVLRAISNDGSFRVIVACTTNTVREALEHQGVQGQTAEHLGALLTGTILVRETMAPQLRVQGILKGAGGKGSLVADSHPDGMTRGLANTAQTEAGLVLGEGAMLQMMRTLPTGQIHQGLVEAPVEQGISGALMSYMHTSEQVTSAIAVGAVMRDGKLVEAGGYIVQLLPELSESLLAIMTERLADFPSIEKLLHEGGVEPKALMSELLYGMPYTETEMSKVFFGCNCSTERIVAGLATLRREDIEGLWREGQTLEITCDFCHKDYKVTPDQLRQLVERLN